MSVFTWLQWTSVCTRYAIIIAVSVQWFAAHSLLKRKAIVVINNYFENRLLRHKYIISLGVLFVVEFT